MEKENLRGYTNYQVLKNVSNPVMFLGLPMKLALIFLAVIMISAFMAMFLKTIDANLLLTVSFPSVFAFVGISIIRYFYKTYGIKGFSMTQRDKKLPEQIRADKSVLQLLRKK